jgi:hypothetical protein
MLGKPPRRQVAGRSCLEVQHASHIILHEHEKRLSFEQANQISWIAGGSVNVDHHVTVTFHNSDCTTSNSYTMAHNDCIAEAIADLKTQDHPNIAATAKGYKVARMTLLDRI